MNKAAILSLTLTLAVSFQPTKAVDWDLVLKTASLSAIAPTMCALMKAPKNLTIIRKVAATCLGLSSVTFAYCAVLLGRSSQASDQFLCFISAGLAGGFGGYACAEAQNLYDEYQNEKAWAKYYIESAAVIKAREELQAQEETHIVVTFGDDPKI